MKLCYGAIIRAIISHIITNIIAKTKDHGETNDSSLFSEHFSWDCKQILFMGIESLLYWCCDNPYGHYFFDVGNMG